MFTVVQRIIELACGQFHPEHDGVEAGRRGEVLLLHHVEERLQLGDGHARVVGRLPQSAPCHAGLQHVRPGVTQAGHVAYQSMRLGEENTLGPPLVLISIQSKVRGKKRI